MKSQPQHEPKLEAHDIRLDYYQPRTGTRLTALDGVNLTIKEGEFVAIVGPSGCGKTTFLFHRRRLDSRQTAGRILVDGRLMTGPAATVPSFSRMPRCCRGGRCCQCLLRARMPRRRQERGQAKVRPFHQHGRVIGFEHHYPHELSGGMQQRVNLARALVVDPQILLMDEPFASLDAQTRELMQEELLQIWLQARKTVLFVTHQIDEDDLFVRPCRRLLRPSGQGQGDHSVDIERPRPLRVKRDARFHAIEDRIWSLIEDDVKADRTRRGMQAGGLRCQATPQ